MEVNNDPIPIHCEIKNQSSLVPMKGIINYEIAAVTYAIRKIIFLPYISKPGPRANSPINAKDPLTAAIYPT